MEFIPFKKFNRLRVKISIHASPATLNTFFLFFTYFVLWEIIYLQVDICMFKKGDVCMN